MSPFKSLETALNICERSPKSAMIGLAKLVRSFPDEKFPPSPMNMMNLISGLF